MKSSDQIRADQETIEARTNAILEARRVRQYTQKKIAAGYAADLPDRYLPKNLRWTTKAS